MSQQCLRVAVVSRYELVRAGLTHLLTACPDGIDVVEVATMHGHLGGHEVIVYDLGGLVDPQESDLPHLLTNGTPIVGLEPDGRPDLADGALAMGVADIVPMDITADQLLQLLDRVAAGHKLAPHARHIDVMNDVRAQAELTEREAEILSLIAAGLSNAEIAERLFVSINTVKTYIRSLYRRIGVKRRPEAVLWAVHRGLAALPEGSDTLLRS